VNKSPVSMARQIAQAVVEFERKVRGHAPESVTVLHGEDTLVITQHGALTPAEKTLAQTPEGAAQMQEFHRRLFEASSESLRQEINKITGVEVRDAAAEVESASGAVLKVFATGTVVQVFLLAGRLPVDAWSSDASIEPPRAPFNAGDDMWRDNGGQG
jgi:uncharacterized protein YbcI